MEVKIQAVLALFNTPCAEAALGRRSKSAATNYLDLRILVIILSELLKRVVASFASSYSNGLFQVADKDFAIADLPAIRRRADCFNNLIR